MLMKIAFILIFMCNINLNTGLTVNSPIVIIGGGVSGLAAFDQLLKAGFRNIRLIEGENRLGGRIYTIPFNASYLEIGAQWVHGQNGNPVFELLNPINELDLSINFYDPNASYFGSTQNGETIDERFFEFVIRNTDEMFDAVFEQQISPTSQRSIGSYLDQLYDSFLKSKSNRYRSTNKNLTESVFRAALQDQKTDYASNDFYEITAAGANENLRFAKNADANLRTGYFKLIDLLRKNINPSSIILNQRVDLIDYSNANGQVIINAVDSSMRKIQYNADAVLVTSSLGYLKQNYKTMFNPGLPAPKVNAIEKLGYGTMNKIFVVFDNNILRVGQQGFRLFWRSDMPDGLPLSDAKWNLYNNRFYKSFSSFDIFPKNKNVLYGALTGNGSIASESLPDECFVDVIFEMFSKFYPNLRLPRPRQVVRSKWTSNPFAKGSYSFVKVGSFPSDVGHLARPIQNKIFFAGEATDIRYTGTVHGALVTGQQQARNIASLITN